jgi:hypothetical protein
MVSRTYWILGIAFVAVIAGSLVISPLLFHRVASPLTGNVRHAAIVDGLAEQMPNATFIEAASSILRGAGFGVDVYSWKAVTVELFRRLPSSYGIVLFRTHSAPGAIFTAEPYDTNRYVYEQLSDEVMIGEIKYLPKDKNRFFAIGPKFVEDYMSFNDTIIVQMGCYGVSAGNNMANAFLNKGAKLYIAWDNWVTPERTDEAALELIRQLVVERATIAQAVQKSMIAIGPDLTYGSLLLYYPKWCGDRTLDQSCPNPFAGT